MSKRKKYSPEFKQEAVELTRMEGVNTNQIAKDLGIGANMLSRWIFPLLKPSRRIARRYEVRKLLSKLAASLQSPSQSSRHRWPRGTLSAPVAPRAGLG